VTEKVAKLIFILFFIVLHIMQWFDGVGCSCSVLCFIYKLFPDVYLLFYIVESAVYFVSVFGRLN